jgi:23S rRNA (cytidine1920-2'-O)/16S rRNA (cytidine1409-2'-O)-methyltransferase
MTKRRADELLVARGLARSRAHGRDLIVRGAVRSEGTVIMKPAARLWPDAPLEVASSGYVSRGGDKLEGALEDLGVVLNDKTCVDVGASTGGFTECALRHGARRVYAVDVGSGQLAPSLRRDERVVVREQTNARWLSSTDFPEVIDVVLVDASFISLSRLAQPLASCVRPGGELIALVKPQFEAGPVVGRTRGVVRDPALRTSALQAARSALQAAGFHVIAEADCRIAGPKGNLERFVHARNGP